MLSTLLSIALCQSVRMLLRRYAGGHATVTFLMFLTVEMFYGSGISRVFVGERLSSQIHWDSIVGVRVWCSWLKHCATSREVAGSIPDGVTGVFHLHNPSGRTVALGSTHPVAEVSTNGICWGGKGGRCVGLTTLPPSYTECLEVWEPETPGTLRACNRPP